MSNPTPEERAGNILAGVTDRYIKTVLQNEDLVLSHAPDAVLKAVYKTLLLGADSVYREWKRRGHTEDILRVMMRSGELKFEKEK